MHCPSAISLRLALCLSLAFVATTTLEAQDAVIQPLIHVSSCQDFELNGQGDHAQWEKAEWVDLNRRPGGEHPYQSRFKMLYSKKGVYVLFDAADKTLTATMREDFMDLWNEDVFECFFWTDTRHPLYFEYEISPLGRELPILIPNLGGEFHGWRPWHYEGDRKTRTSVGVTGGKQKSMASIDRWKAEVFIPYELLKPLQNVPPKKGTQWRANFYRVDYDGGKTTGWDWARVGGSFHEYRKFGTIVFD